MKRLIAVACLLACAMLASGDLAVPAQADVIPQAFLGEFCWKLDPFVDTMRLALTSTGSTVSINGRWRSAAKYSVAVSGTLSPDAVRGGNDLSLVWADYNDTTPDYTGGAGFFHAKLSGGSNGVWKARRDDGMAATGTFTRLASCPATAVAEAGPSALD